MALSHYTQAKTDVHQRSERCTERAALRTTFPVKYGLDSTTALAAARFPALMIISEPRESGIVFAGGASSAARIAPLRSAFKNTSV